MNNALFETFRQSGIVGQLIIIFLLGLSVYAWYIILDKLRSLNAAEKNSRAFLRKFGMEREHIFSLHFPAQLAAACPLYRIYEAGVREAGHQESQGGSSPGLVNPALSTDKLDSIENALRRTISSETLAMERMVIVLAVTATISPLMGLLGTVWGIMNAFRGMAAAGSASIGTVAPGISEALVTTVVGLLVAIPALAGYNVISNKIRRLTAEMNDFASEFMSVVKKAS